MPRIEPLPKAEIARDAREVIVELPVTVDESRGPGRLLHTFDKLRDQQPVVQRSHTPVAPSNRG